MWYKQRSFRHFHPWHPLLSLVSTANPGPLRLQPERVRHYDTRRQLYAAPGQASCLIRFASGFVASPAPEAQSALKRLSKRYGAVEPEGADVVIALGGDGLMLQTLHRFMGTGVPIYGMHRGSVGFLMNEFHETRLLERVAQAKLSVIHPLKMVAENVAGETLQALAINEVHLYRQTAQSARLSITVDGKEQMSELICDGVLVATPAGSTAYNLSVGGPILPLKAHLLALDPDQPVPAQALARRPAAQ